MNGVWLTSQLYSTEPNRRQKTSIAGDDRDDAEPQQRRVRAIDDQRAAHIGSDRERHVAGRSIHGHEAACGIDVIEGDDEIANDIAPHDLEYRIDHEERYDRIGCEVRIDHS